MQIAQVSSDSDRRIRLTTEEENDLRGNIIDFAKQFDVLDSEQVGMPYSTICSKIADIYNSKHASHRALNANIVNHRIQLMIKEGSIEYVTLGKGAQIAGIKTTGKSPSPFTVKSKDKAPAELKNSVVRYHAFRHIMALFGENFAKSHEKKIINVSLITTRLLQTPGFDAFNKGHIQSRLNRLIDDITKKGLIRYDKHGLLGVLSQVSPDDTEMCNQLEVLKRAMDEELDENSPTQPIIVKSSVPPVIPPASPKPVSTPKISPPVPPSPSGKLKFTSRAEALDHIIRHEPPTTIKMSRSEIMEIMKMKGYAIEAVNIAALINEYRLLVIRCATVELKGSFYVFEKHTTLNIKQDTSKEPTPATDSGVTPVQPKPSAPPVIDPLPADAYISKNEFAALGPKAVYIPESVFVDTVRYFIQQKGHGMARVKSNVFTAHVNELLKAEMSGLTIRKIMHVCGAKRASTLPYTMKFDTDNRMYTFTWNRKKEPTEVSSVSDPAPPKPQQVDLGNKPPTPALPLEEMIAHELQALEASELEYSKEEAQLADRKCEAQAALKNLTERLAQIEQDSESNIRTLEAKFAKLKELINAPGNSATMKSLLNERMEAHAQEITTLKNSAGTTKLAAKNAVDELTDASVAYETFVNKRREVIDRIHVLKDMQTAL